MRRSTLDKQTDVVLNPVGLNTPPSGVPNQPPISQLIDRLYFDALAWEDFERLCVRMAKKDRALELVQSYGRRGQAQKGIDIFARSTTGKYTVWQCKHYAQYRKADLTKALKAFEAGAWKKKSDKLILAVQCLIDDTTLQDEIERQHKRLAKKGIELCVYGAVELSDFLRNDPETIYAFFGLAWVERFLGAESAVRFRERVSSTDFNKIRHQLGAHYASHYQLFDGQFMAVGLVSDAADAGPNLLENFTEPDIETFSRTQSTDSSNTSSQAPSNQEAAIEEKKSELSSRDAPKQKTIRRRIPLGQWLSDTSLTAIFGEAGTGKSTILRAIALDLLGSQALFPEIAPQWGDRLPILVPFSRWVRANIANGAPIGLKEIIQISLQPNLNAEFVSQIGRLVDERRILLLIDGLDEWSEEQAAITTIGHILSFVTANSIPTVVTARPRGLAKVWSIPANWNSGYVAELSRLQQYELVLKSLTRRTLTNDIDRNRIERQTDAFLAQVHADPGIALLATTPLMLRGLLILSIRNISLPRNRSQAVRQLVEVLLDEHPKRRAAQAGDTSVRFLYATDLDLRREVLARLAFEIRSVGADSGYPIASAIHLVKQSLIDANHRGLSLEKATNIANEILAVNAETTGLLIEKSAGHIGFSHAVFEELLCAAHLSSQSFSEAKLFLAEKCGEPRWRNVIVNLLTLLERWQEVDELIDVISAVNGDVIFEANKSLVLAETAFSSAKKSSGKANELISVALQKIENGPWPAERRALLKLALNSLTESDGEGSVRTAFSYWAPRVEENVGYSLRHFDKWPETEKLKSTLLRCLLDEERGTQIEAAIFLAKHFSGDEATLAKLREIYLSTSSLAAAASVLLAMREGWGAFESVQELYSDAVASNYPPLRLQGIYGLFDSGAGHKQHLDLVLAMLIQFSPLPYSDRPMATKLLSDGWRDDPDVISVALRSVRRGRDRTDMLDRDFAVPFLLSCSERNPEIVKWLEAELTERYPFTISDNHSWAHIARFAQRNSTVRSKAVKYITSDEGSHFTHRFMDYFESDKGEDLRDWLIGHFRSSRYMDQYWALNALLRAWGKHDPKVSLLLDDIRAKPLNEIVLLTSFFPTIFNGDARKKLLEVAASDADIRNDFLAAGFARAGCDEADEEVVQVLLGTITDHFSFKNGSDSIIQHFPKHLAVREIAISRLQMRDPPLSVVAASYPGDPEISDLLLPLLSPLPTYLRSVIADFAETPASHHAVLGQLRQGYDLEVDPEIKIRLAIAHFSSVTASDDELKTLLDNCYAVGPDYEIRRAAAFAGFVAQGKFKQFGELKDRDGSPMNTHILGMRVGDDNLPLSALIARNWSALKAEFGDSFFVRLSDNSNEADTRIWEFLAPSLQYSEVAKADFLSWCSDSKAKLPIRCLQALARLQPGTVFLKEKCVQVMSDRVDGPLGAVQARLNAAALLRDHFEFDDHLVEMLEKELSDTPTFSTLRVLLGYAPIKAVADKVKLTPHECGFKYQQWAVAVALSCLLDSPNDFTSILLGMCGRTKHGPWDFQDYANRFAVLRLQSDAAARAASATVAFSNANAKATLPRYLTAAGYDDGSFLQLARSELESEYRRNAVISAGYDALEDSIRPVALALFDALAGTAQL